MSRSFRALVGLFVSKGKAMKEDCIGFSFVCILDRLHSQGEHRRVMEMSNYVVEKWLTKLWGQLGGFSCLLIGLDCCLKCILSRYVVCM